MKAKIDRESSEGDENGTMRSPDQEASERDTWTHEEMREAEPFPLPELPAEPAEEES